MDFMEFPARHQLSLSQIERIWQRVLGSGSPETPEEPCISSARPSAAPENIRPVDMHDAPAAPCSSGDQTLSRCIDEKRSRAALCRAAAAKSPDRASARLLRNLAGVQEHHERRLRTAANAVQKPARPARIGLSGRTYAQLLSELFRACLRQAKKYACLARRAEDPALKTLLSGLCQDDAADAGRVLTLFAQKKR